MFGGSNEQSGTVGFLVGIIVLVFAGIALSLMVDKRFRFSSGRISLEQLVAEEKRHLADARRRVEAAEERWRKEFQPKVGQADELAKARAAVVETAAALPGLRERRAALAAEIEAVSAEFADYRDRFRKQVRQDAAGEKLSEIKTRSGKAYRGVVIRRVTAAGMEIAHSLGIARLRPDDLGGDWRERFQWEDGEAEAALDRERSAARRHERAVASAAAARQPAPPAKLAGSRKHPARQEAEKQLASLRRDVTEAKRHLARAEMEAARARSEALANRGKSVPGSLETWAEKAARLESASATFRGRYVAARGRLATAAPDDALLRDDSR